MRTTLKISSHIQTIARELERRLEDAAASPIKFSLFIWSDAGCNIVSSIDEDGLLEALKSIVSRMENGAAASRKVN